MSGLVLSKQRGIHGSYLSHVNCGSLQKAILKHESVGGFLDYCFLRTQGSGNVQHYHLLMCEWINNTW